MNIKDYSEIQDDKDYVYVSGQPYSAQYEFDIQIKKGHQVTPRDVAFGRIFADKDTTKKWLLSIIDKHFTPMEKRLRKQAEKFKS